jgi:hopanoid biosynthesis associated protein HpnK
VLTAASLMVAGPAAGQAVVLARRLPDLRIGLHLCLVDEDPVLAPEEIPGLVGPDGRLRQDMVRLALDLALSRGLRRQARREIAAQFEAFRRSGLALDHVDGHRHFHVHPIVGHLVLALGRQNGMRALRAPREPAAVLDRIESAPRRTRDPVGPWAALLQARARRLGIVTPDAVFGTRWSGAFTTARLARLLERLPDGLIEIYMHPATRDDVAGHGAGYRGSLELQALTDEAVVAACARIDHRPGGFIDALG